MRVAQRKCVQTGAKDDDLPGPSFHSFRQGVFRNPAPCGGKQTSGADQGMFVRKPKNILFVFAQDRHGKRVIED